MNVLFKPTFIKDFKSLPREVRRQIKMICVESFSRAKDLKELAEYDIKALKSFRNYYRNQMRGLSDWFQERKSYHHFYARAAPKRHLSVFSVTKRDHGALFSFCFASPQSHR